jgi:hypothetical protein
MKSRRNIPAAFGLNLLSSLRQIIFDDKHRLVGGGGISAEEI